jgi:Icc-related predicted phosphoesterase
VFGNHECWYNGLDAANTVRSSFQHLKNVYLLENSSITIDGIEFFGCTLWPDYKQADPYVIRYAQTIDKNLLYIGVDFQTIQEKQRESVETLRTLPYNKNRVIITHYPPTCLSITDEFNADDIEIQYLCYSEITDGVFALSPLAWMHGHIHNSVNYKIGDTDVLANPRGDHFVRNARFDIKQSYTLDC